MNVKKNEILFSFWKRLALLIAQAPHPILKLSKHLYHTSLFISAKLWLLHSKVICIQVIGSVATDNFHPGLSDIDLVIITKNSPPMRWIKSICNLIYPYYPNCTLHQHFFIYTESEWMEIGYFFLFHPLRPIKRVAGFSVQPTVYKFDWPGAIAKEYEYLDDQVQAKSDKVIKNPYEVALIKRDIEKLKMWRSFSKKSDIPVLHMEKFWNRNHPSHSKWNEFWKLKI